MQRDPHVRRFSYRGPLAAVFVFRNDGNLRIVFASFAFANLDTTPIANETITTERELVAENLVATEKEVIADLMTDIAWTHSAGGFSRDELLRKIDESFRK